MNTQIIVQQIVATSVDESKTFEAKDDLRFDENSKHVDEMHHEIGTYNHIPDNNKTENRQKSGQTMDS